MSTRTKPNVQIHENVLILTVDNLLTGWPTYIIDFTPEQLGPMKLLLRLNDTRKALEQDEAYRIIPKYTNTIPVELHGICKGPKLAKCNIFDHDLVDDTPWPPIRPRAFREVGMNVPMTSLHMIKTIPTPVKAVSAGKENSHI
ncbi:hypothetical protein PAXRUDRAFT_17866 [Paxillus rubicundulus Ve08.2h10]|uniref:Uncharacterized protein n=1 Tax=Paxillus rubicundulus Ve08.2h10 TaxID=930991 RepID=A0A0D0DGA3_9AGAM|nr:hypothetical protein PAXRUDRAFT_17866 [Paxillus rubicundulus Ve08.2h10]